MSIEYSSIAMATNGYLHGVLAIATEGFLYEEVTVQPPIEPPVKPPQPPGGPTVQPPFGRPTVPGGLGLHGGLFAIPPTLEGAAGVEREVDRDTLARVAAASIGVALEDGGLPEQLAATLGLVLDSEDGET